MKPKPNLEDGKKVYYLMMIIAQNLWHLSWKNEKKRNDEINKD